MWLRHAFITSTCESRSRNTADAYRHSGVRTGSINNWFAVLGAEDKMNEVLGERLRHRSILAPLQGANELHGRNPGRCPGLLTVGAFSAVTLDYSSFRR